MGSSTYAINKNISTPITFKGFKGQYIWYLGAGLVLLLIMFAALYIVGVHPILCLLIIIPLCSALFYHMARMSRKYGVHGLQKKWAEKRLPTVLISRSRKIFKIDKLD